MKSLSPVFRHVDEHRSDFLSRLIEYAARPSISAQGIGIEETAEYVAGILRRLGLETRLLPTTGWPMVLASSPVVPGTPTVLLYGHYDVQPPEPLEAWDSPPFTPTVRGGRLYGRGVADNKGQHLAQILALESLLAIHGELPCTVKVLLEGEEEVGSPHVSAVVRDHREALACDLVITSDGPVHANGCACILFGVRGVLSFELRATGANRDLHSGNWGGVAPNPLWTLVHLLASMKNDRGEILIEGFYDAARPLTEHERLAMEVLPVDVEAVKADLGIAEFDLPAHEVYYERVMAWPTLTINGLHGGYGGPGSKTVLPHEAVAKCDIRLVVDQSAEDIFSRVVDHVRRHAPGVEVVYQGAMNPSRTPLNSPFAEPLRQGIADAQSEGPLLVPSLGGSLPEYVFTQDLGVPAFTVPYANADLANHAPNENLEIERFYAGIKTGAAILARLGEMGTISHAS